MEKRDDGSLVVHVNAGRGYDVTVGRGLLARAASLVPADERTVRVVIVADEITEDLFMDQVMASFMGAGYEVSSFVFQHGETSKRIHAYASIVEHLAARRLSRSDLVVALGGGVVGDLAGFAAATYMRGCRFVQIPTTLLAAVDSSVGGKTGIDLDAGKNLVGAFYQPEAVICDVECLDSLPDAEFANGLAEALKYGVLCDEELFELLQRDPRGQAQELVARCVDIKRRYVEADEREAGDRRFLNLGHTFGHAIEKASDYTVAHGSAVAMGMVMAARYAASRGMAAPGLVVQIAGALEACGLPTAADLPEGQLARAALSDKKRQGQSIVFVLPRAVGSCVLVPVPLADVPAAFGA